MDIMALEQQFGAANYSPLPVVLSRGVGVHVWDIEGNRYLDAMSAYSAVSHGHCHPRLVKTLTEQASRLAVVSRAYYSDQLALLLEKLCHMTGFDKALPMNTGTEAVETALKAARKWAYTRKGVVQDKAEIIVCDGNFHGRTITIVGMSSEAQYKQGFGPFPPGFVHVPYDDSQALANAMTNNTAAVLLEPIQGEGGIIIPQPGYLRRCREICDHHNVLLIVDEIQTGLGRTGAFIACEHESIQPDGLILGKALGGGLLPVSMFLTNQTLMDVFTPGDHGSTFGGNPLAAAVAREALQVIEDEGLTQRANELGEYFLQQLQLTDCTYVTDIRGKGLLLGIEIDKKVRAARDVCLALMAKGLLSKETHETVVRIAPPLIITREQIDEAIMIIRSVLI